MRPLLLMTLTVFSFVLMVNFQNCGKLPTSQLNTASLTKLSPQGEYYDKQLIVKMSSPEAHQRLYEWAQANSLSNMNQDSAESLKMWDDKNMSHWSWEGPHEVSEMMTKLKDEMGADVEYAEPNFQFYESLSQSLSDIPETSQILTFADPFVFSLSNVPSQLTSLEPGKKRPIVAIIDSGVDISHLAFVNSQAIWRNLGETGTDGLGQNKATNGIDDDGNGFIDDVNGYNFRARNANISDSTGHGTHCAGIALGVGHNIFDLSLNSTNSPEFRSKIQIMPIKFIDAQGGATSDAVNAIFYAVRNGADVLSNSWGGPSYSRALEDAIAFAYENNVPFIAAAGNNARNNDTVAVYPANYKNVKVMSVAATDNRDRLASFSNFGTGTVDLAAPGVSILSLARKPSGAAESNFYDYLSGTSMATPFVAGTAALVLYENPDLSINQVYDILVQSSDPAVSLTKAIKNPVRLNPEMSIAQSKTTVPGQKLELVERSIASANSEVDAVGAAAGCGLVKAIASNQPRPPAAPPAVLLVLLALPLFANRLLRRRVWC